MTQHIINTVPGTLQTGTYANGRTRQRWTSEARPWKEGRDGWGRNVRLYAEIRFDNELGNQRSSFSITAGVTNAARSCDNGSIGCNHEAIAAVFPELAHLIKWHLHGTDKPWSYDSTVYFAGERDHSGRLKGEPWGWHEAIRFGTVPMLHRIKKGLYDFMTEIADYDPEGLAFALIPVAVAGPDRGGMSSGTFSPKYQFAGQPPLKWHDCAFDSEGEAEAFAQSCIGHGWTLERIPHLFSEGKARELDHARRAAVWPNATDEELSGDPAALREKLAARLPMLMASFKGEIAAAGLSWPEGE